MRPGFPFMIGAKTGDPGRVDPLCMAHADRIQQWPIALIKKHHTVDSVGRTKIHSHRLPELPYIGLKETHGAALSSLQIDLGHIFYKSKVIGIAKTVLYAANDLHSPLLCLR